MSSDENYYFNPYCGVLEDLLSLQADETKKLQCDETYAKLEGNLNAFRNKFVNSDSISESDHTQTDHGKGYDQLMQNLRLESAENYTVVDITSNDQDDMLQMQCRELPISEYNENLLDILREACVGGFFRIIHEILKINPSMDLKADKNPPLLCITGTKMQNYVPIDKIDYARSFELLLEFNRIKECINDLDQSRCSAIYYAAKFKNERFIMKVLQLGAFFGGLEEKINIDPRLLEKHFNFCIKDSSYSTGSSDYEIKFDYTNFMAYHCDHEAPQFSHTINLMNCISKSPRDRYLVIHPLIKNWVTIKWHDTRSLFIYNYIFCVLLFLTAMFLALDTHHVSRWYGRACTIAAYITLAYLVTREIMQFVLSDMKSYFSCVINLVELSTIGILFYSLILMHFSKRNDYDPIEKAVTTIGILFIAWECISMFKVLPFTSMVYVQMFEKVARNIIKLLSIYFVILMAFAAGFFVLFRNRHYLKPYKSPDKSENFNNFQSASTAVLKTFLMFAGEYDASDIDFNVHPASYFIFFLFIFLGSMVLINLLNGLAINDIRELQEYAAIHKQIHRIRVLHSYGEYLQKLSCVANLPRLIDRIFRLCSNNAKCFKNLTGSNAIKTVTIIPNRNCLNIIVCAFNGAEKEIKTNDINKSIVEECRVLFEKREAELKSEEEKKKLAVILNSIILKS